MSADLDERTRDTAVWFVQNRNRIPRENLLKRVEFLEKTCSCLIELLAITARDMMDAERRPLHQRLWLPAEVSVDDNPPVKLR